MYKNDNTFYYIEVKGYTKKTNYLKWQAVKDQSLKLKVWYNEHLVANEHLVTYKI